MSRNDRRHGNRNRNWNNKNTSERNERSDKDRKSQHEARGTASYERRQERRHLLNQISQKEIEESKIAIKAFKENVINCEICGNPIEDIANAISNKNSGKPVHFDCVLNKITDEEKLSPSERVAYIGQGKFAVLYSANPHDQKHFTIKKTIEWEARDSQRGEWRNEMAGLFSQVK